jgi:polyferredoxin
MTEDQEQKLQAELEFYRGLIAENEKKSKRWDTIAANWLGQFVAYSLIVFLLFLSWNWALVQIWPNIPEVTFIQMAGLWYLSSVLLKRD